MSSNLKKIAFVSTLIVLIIAGIWAYQSNSSNVATQNTVVKTDSNTRFKISTSFYPIFSFAKSIAGDKIDVINVTPAGAEAHDFEPSAQQIAEIYKSDLFIYNGAGVDAWAEKLVSNLENQKVKTLNLSEELASQDLIITEGAKDPHFWLDPVLAQNQIDIINSEIIKIDSNNQNYYDTNSKSTKSLLQDLDTAFKTKLGECFQNKIVVSHDAFSYLSMRYGFEIIPISGLAPEAELSLQEISEISRQIKEEEIKFVASEALIDPKLANTIAEETGAKVLVLNPIEGLTEEELQSNQNYFTKMNENIESLKTMLECK